MPTTNYMTLIVLLKPSLSSAAEIATIDAVVATVTCPAFMYQSLCYFSKIWSRVRIWGCLVKTASMPSWDSSTSASKLTTANRPHRRRAESHLKWDFTHASRNQFTGLENWNIRPDLIVFWVNGEFLCAIPFPVRSKGKRDSQVAIRPIITIWISRLAHILVKISRNQVLLEQPNLLLPSFNTRTALLEWVRYPKWHSR